MVDVDVVVIGGGIAGAAAAWALSSHTSVVLLEAEPGVGYHSTGRSAAILSQTYEAPIVRQLARASRSILDDEFTNLDRLLVDRPVLWVAGHRQWEAFERARVAAERGPGNVDVLDEDQCRRMCPVLRDGTLIGGLCESGAKAIDVDLLHQEFLRRASAGGAKVMVSHPVKSIARLAGRWRVDADGSSIRATHIVNAAGAWADQVAEMAGLPAAGLSPLRRTAFLFPANPDDGHESWPFTIDVEESWYFEPNGPVMLGSNCDEHPDAPRDVHAEDIDVAEAIEKINRVTTLGIRRVLKQWAGLRTFARDRLPVIGPDPDEPTFHWYAGLGGFGIMTSPALGTVVADLVLGRSPAPWTESVAQAASADRLRAM